MSDGMRTKKLCKSCSGEIRVRWEAATECPHCSYLTFYKECVHTPFDKDREVNLTEIELDMARVVGGSRMRESRKSGRSNMHGLKSRDQEIDFLGACGEMAAAKYYGIYFFPSINNFKDPDVAGMQIRCGSQAGYSLIVREDDADDCPFVLVTADNISLGQFTVHGWLFGSEAKANPKWKRAHNEREAAWFVPRFKLKTTLPPII